MTHHNINCSRCSGTGNIVACGWCVLNEQHSNCDDTYTYQCECRNDWKLFLDDEARTPGMEAFRYPPQGEPNWHIACSSDEAIKLIDRYGPPCYISFDHDLGMLPDGQADTSMRVLKHLTHNYYNAEIDYQVHSKNGPGRLNIISWMESWEQSKRI